jgi:hypothetical protein
MRIVDGKRPPLGPADLPAEHDTGAAIGAAAKKLSLLTPFAADRLHHGVAVLTQPSQLRACSPKLSYRETGPSRLRSRCHRAHIGWSLTSRSKCAR